MKHLAASFFAVMPMTTNYIEIESVCVKMCDKICECEKEINCVCVSVDLENDVSLL